jgi:hypothetical protein
VDRWRRGIAGAAMVVTAAETGGDGEIRRGVRLPMTSWRIEPVRIAPSGELDDINAVVNRYDVLTRAKHSDGIASHRQRGTERGVITRMTTAVASRLLLRSAAFASTAYFRYQVACGVRSDKCDIGSMQRTVARR